MGGPSSYGTGPGVMPNSREGDNFGITQTPSLDLNFILPEGYISNSPLSGTMTFDNQTFATLGLAEGTYTWSWSADGNNDSLTLNIPEPASTLLDHLPLPPPSYVVAGPFDPAHRVDPGSNCEQNPARGKAARKTSPAKTAQPTPTSLSVSMINCSCNVNPVVEAPPRW